MTTPDPGQGAPAILRTEGITRIYRTGAVEVQALRGIDLHLAEGEMVVLLGASGSGKSTLLNIPGGLDRPTEGRVFFRDRELTRLSEAALTAYRRDHVGFVFQFYNLVPSLTARENVALVTEIAAHPMRPEEALERVGLGHRLHHFPSELSGGEQQRVAIARAIAKRPDLLLCDEPTGALGWAGGRALGQQMTALYTDYFRFPWLIYRPGTGAVLLSGLLGMVSVVLGALRAVLGSVRLPPAVAMAPPAPPAFRRGWLDRVGRVLGLRQTTMMILRSITRWPGRAAVTVLGVAASVAVLVASFFTLDASRLMMDELFTQTNREDATLTLSAPRPAIAVAEALRLPGVRRAEGAFAMPVRLTNGLRSELVAVEARAEGAELTRLVDDLGWPVAMPPAGLVLPERLAGKLDVAVGDLLRMELLSPPRDTVTVRVAAVVRQSLGEGGRMAEDALFALMRTDPQVSRIDLLVDPARIPALHAAVKDTPAVAGIMLWTDLRATFEELFNRSLLTSTLIFTAVGALITVGVVYNAARIQLSERAHELASLRVLGFTRAEVGYVLVGEIMRLSLLAVPLGWELGYGFARGVVSGVSTDIVTLPFAISRRTWALATLAALAAALGSALLVRRRLDRVDLVSALKRKE